MNIMLLAMSTFPRNVVPLQAASQENETVYSYFTQLEPGCKHLFCKLAEEGKKFDKVIALCTPETLNKYAGKYIEFGGEKTKKTIDISSLSPYAFFEDRMLSFIRNDSSSFKYEEELGVNIENFAKFTFEEFYSEEDLSLLFESVSVENNDLKIADAIKDVIAKINEMTKDVDSSIDLYLNAQGGSRTNIQIINTVLNMLKTRKYKLMEVNVINFNGDKVQDSFPILNVTDSYLMNDLAAAMNAFLQYGRGDMFADYYERYKSERGLKTAPEDGVVKSINKISDAILLCNTDDFLKGIEQLKKSVKEYDLLENDIKDPFFELIVNDIKNSYKELFNSSDIIDDLDVLVDWCMERGLIQQILTILEAKTPFFVFKRGFIYGKESEETNQAFNELKKNGNIPKYKFDNRIYLLVNTFCMLNCDNEKNSNGNKVWKAKIDFVKKQEKTESMIASEYKFDMANPGICTNKYSTNLRKKNRGEKNCSITPIFVPIYSDWFSNNSEIYRDDPSGIENAKCIMRDFVRLYRTICVIRNNANHSNNEIKIETIIKRIRDLNDVLKTIKRQTLSGVNYSFYNTDQFN